MVDETDAKSAEAEGRSPGWQRWAAVLVLLGCAATIAATYYDIL